MAVPTQDFTGEYAWEQGEDHLIIVNYAVTPDDEDDTGFITLSPETHDIRMDIAPVNGSPFYTLNTEDEDGEGEVTFGDNNRIEIRIPRTVTIGPDAPKMTKKVAMYEYDVFLRNKMTGYQRKILTGKIAVNRSVTHWL